MKNNIIVSMAIALVMLSGCDYNDKYFDGYDDNPIADLATYEGDFTGTYPSEGYFTSKDAVQTAVNTMLKGIYPYCDEGSSAKVSLLYGDVAADYVLQEADVTYTLTSDDYNAMGEESGQPGKFDNFDSSMDVNTYLTAFCTTNYGDLAVGKTVSIYYKYYSGSVSTLMKTFEKTAEGWSEIELNGFIPDATYTLTTEDYDSMGTASGTPGKYNNFDSNMDVDFYISTFLKMKFPYTEAGTTYEVSYKYYASSVTSTKTATYKYDGSSWTAYDPYAEITTVTTKVAEMSFNGTSWTLVRLLGGTVKYTFQSDDYVTLVDWVLNNQPAYMSTQNVTQEEYYFGASAKYNNINNKYYTWSSYYNVDGYLTGKSDDEIQTIMDDRLAWGIEELLLPKWVTTPDPGISYVVTYKIYGGRGDGYYAMSFMYNSDTQKYEKVAGPVAQ